MGRELNNIVAQLKDTNATLENGFKTEQDTVDGNGNVIEKEPLTGMGVVATHEKRPSHVRCKNVFFDGFEGSIFETESIRYTLKDNDGGRSRSLWDNYG